MIPLARTAVTENDVLRLGAQGRWVEVVDGEITPMGPVGLQHHIIAGNVYNALYEYLKIRRSGYVLMDGLLYILESDAEGLREARVPDVSFVRKGRIPKGFDPTRPFPGPPDLAAEVMSPDEGVEDVLNKVRDYLQAGTEQVWVIFPRQQEVHQYRRDAPHNVRIYRGDEVIDAAPLLEGLTLAARDIFVMPD